MLFFVNKSNPSLLKRLALVGGDEDKILLLVGDGENLNVEEIYAETDAVQERNLTVCDNCKTVNFDKIADLIFDEEQVVSL